MLYSKQHTFHLDIRRKDSYNLAEVFLTIVGDGSYVNKANQF